MPALCIRPPRNTVPLNRPVSVRSYWKGMVAFVAAPFLPPSNLRFRGASDTLGEWHVEGSECCLIHYHNIAPGKGVWLNLNVKVGCGVELFGL